MKDLGILRNTLRNEGKEFLILWDNVMGDWEIWVPHKGTSSLVTTFTQYGDFIHQRIVYTTIPGMVEVILRNNWKTFQFDHVKWERGDNK